MKNGYNAFSDSATKIRTRQSVYDILKKYNLYDEVKETIYHLNIKYLPYIELINKIAPNKQMTQQEQAFLIAETIKLCDQNNPKYNQKLDEELTMFGITSEYNPKGFYEEKETCFTK